MTISLFFTVLALVLLLLAALDVPAKWVSYGWAGLFFWLLSTIVR
jgi:hypothetical protein